MATLGALQREPSRRDELFRETLDDTLRRWALGLVWPLKPERIGGVPGLAWMWVRELLLPAGGLPDPEAALDKPLGLAGFARDLSVPTLMAAYGRGLYPFGHVGSPKWLSPPERSVLFLDEFHVSKRILSRMRQNRHTVTFDADFEGVVKACAEPRPGKLPLTWITPRIMRAYGELFDAGHAHSFEVRDKAGDLVGGGYGVAVGGVFVIESQFARESGASKIGFAVLIRHLARWGFRLADNKLLTDNVAQMGFRDIPRSEYLARLAEESSAGRSGRWHAEADPRTVAIELAARASRDKSA